MKCNQSAIPDVLVFEPVVHHDERGFFKEVLRESSFNQFLSLYGQPSQSLVQENLSQSKRHVLRGLHFQSQQPQGKLVSVVHGEVFDVAVDIRPHSETYGQWVGHILSNQNHQQVWIPPGFAHGFLVLSESADVLYKCSSYYMAGDQQGILWSDPTLAIDWPLAKGQSPILSVQDVTQPLFRGE
ncbi:dTDP-4-dehydrorhamnose 3,5-epimerase [Shewanella gelidii]|uniref:dTDP-4-dehydrorhamnose 3,5-epimerase n=1 Tax=Shewanella gelidii TaxID=1642821 RepID=A0A917JJG8_9GAMM|nr:dTDP-4-dehydrorhamnose 3,5-epimerase [Shewanella gelidii]MCL1096413.1 dTDP-4-dehydrorhamnose 3,5-epimerase [Shewanella gelidii]GGI67245.1 dTDP-4-dehydrorhamnose 3,5-epimerase [Shewanella gelidii]